MVARNRRELYQVNANKYLPGTVHNGVVHSVKPFGVFVKLEPGVFGLVKIVSTNELGLPKTDAQVTCEVIASEVGDHGLKINLRLVAVLSGGDPELPDGPCSTV